MSVRRRVLLVTSLGVALLVVAFAFTLRSERPEPMVTGGRMGTMPTYRPDFPVDPRMPVLDSLLPLRRDTSARQKRGAPLRPWQPTSPYDYRIRTDTPTSGKSPNIPSTPSAANRRHSAPASPP